MAFSVPELFDHLAITQSADQKKADINLFRQTLKTGSDLLEADFRKNLQAEHLVLARADMIDFILQQAWRCFFEAEDEDITLVAVGGYGRGELHPFSDIDLLILLGDDCEEKYNDTIGQFLTFLWDIGLEIGQSVRTIQDCENEGREDITVTTNMIESRLLSGSETLFRAMKEIISDNNIWPSAHFFEAKWKEQQRRHEKFHDTAYNLEPNIKEGPGGLRDIQMIGWVAKRHFSTDNLHDLVKHKYLTENEYQALINGQNHLWTIRFAIHIHTRRREDRLLFDYQNDIARMLGYEDKDNNLAVEQFMQSYYRTIMELHRLNEMLLQLFQEAILYSNYDINTRFRSRMGFLEVRNENVFENYPFALLEVFLLLEQQPELKGVRAETIRLIRSNTHRIDDDFRNDIRAKSLFMEIMRQPEGITHELRRMNRYGVLAAYLPDFGKLVGRMQYDLFHAYTVDEHILFVVRNLRRFTVPEYSHEFPLCSRVSNDIPKPELLYIAGLMHDIGKGRGGDHSIIGAGIAREFCLDHHLSNWDAELVSWLVEHHLSMSTVITKKDINDPEVIHDFAVLVGSTTRLNYLYLLTVADIRGTNPKLWNSWKATLLNELYTATVDALMRGLERPMSEEEQIIKIRNGAMQLLKGRQFPEQMITDFWNKASQDYFLNHSSTEIAWHTEIILASDENNLPLVQLQIQEDRGSTAVLIYGPFNDHQFARTTSTLEQLHLAIVDARITNTDDGYSLDTFRLIEEDNREITDPARLDEIRKALDHHLKQSRMDEPVTITRRTPRQLQYFKTPTRVAFSQESGQQYTVIRVSTTDRPGVLSRIAQAFSDCEIRLKVARINTIGPTIEDVFYVTDFEDRNITDQEKLDNLERVIVEKLETGG